MNSCLNLLEGKNKFCLHSEYLNEYHGFLSLEVSGREEGILLETKMHEMRMKLSGMEVKYQSWIWWLKLPIGCENFYLGVESYLENMVNGTVYLQTRVLILPEMSHHKS